MNQFLSVASGKCNHQNRFAHFIVNIDMKYGPMNTIEQKHRH